MRDKDETRLGGPVVVLSVENVRPQISLSFVFCGHCNTLDKAVNAESISTINNAVFEIMA